MKEVSIMTGWLEKIQKIPDEEMKIFVKISEMCVNHLDKNPEVAIAVANMMIKYIDKNY